jgi:hypothetical protein
MAAGSITHRNMGGASLALPIIKPIWSKEKYKKIIRNIAKEVTLLKQNIIECID